MRSFSLVLMLLLVTACSHRDTAEKPAGQPAATGTASAALTPTPEFVFACDSLEFSVTLNGDTAVVTTPTARYRLPHVPSASGTHYTDGAVSFWNKGDEALLEVPGAVFRNCRMKP